MQFSLKQKQTIIVAIAIAAVIWSAALYTGYNSSRISSVEVEAPKTKAAQDPSLAAKVGIGTSAPEGSIHIKNALKNTPGVLLGMPNYYRPNFYRGLPMQWQGGESKFGKWRQWFNWTEDSWTLGYNFVFDYQTYSKGDMLRDVEDISTFARFDLAEGTSGFWEMIWGKAPSAATRDGAVYVMTAGCGAAAENKNCPKVGPAAQLKIEGTYGMGGVLSLKAGNNEINLTSEGVPDWDWTFSKHFRITNGDTGLNLMSIYVPFEKNDPNFGNVGIGTKKREDQNGHKLSVVGTAGLTTGTAWTQISDSRFKDVQAGLKGSSLEKIMALRPVAYRWNSLYQSKYGEKDGLNYGFVAQDVQKVIPEFITQDNEGYYWYNPSGFEAILTAAVQERQKQIEVFKTEIKELKIKYDL